MFEKLSRREVWRYLGYKGSEPDETVCQLVEETIEMVENAAVPRQVSKRVTCKIQPDNRLFLGSLEVTSQSLAKHLRAATKLSCLPPHWAAALTGYCSGITGSRSAGQRYCRLFLPLRWKNGATSARNSWVMGWKKDCIFVHGSVRDMVICRWHFSVRCWNHWKPGNGLVSN